MIDQADDTATVLVFGKIEDLRIERQGGVWAAESATYPGCVGYGDSCDRAIQNARESLADRLRGGC